MHQLVDNIFARCFAHQGHKLVELVAEYSLFFLYRGGIDDKRVDREYDLH